VPKEEIDAMRANAAPIEEYFSSRNPLVTLIRELTKRKDLHYIHIKKGGFSLSLKQNEKH